MSTSRYDIQSTLVISKSKGLSEILRDIRTSTYQICRIEEKINRTTTFNKYICNLTPEVRDISKILWKRREIAPGEQFLFFSTIFCYLLSDFHVSVGTKFSLRDKRSFEISEVEITRVSCIIIPTSAHLHCNKGSINRLQEQGFRFSEYHLIEYI